MGFKYILYLGATEDFASCGSHSFPFNFLWGLKIQNGNVFLRFLDLSCSCGLNCPGAENKCRLKLGKSPKLVVLFSFLSSMFPSMWGGERQQTQLEA